MKYVDFIKKFREYLTSKNYDKDTIIFLADSVDHDGVSNYVDYIVYCRFIVRSEVIDKAGELVPELHSIVKELNIKY